MTSLHFHRRRVGFFVAGLLVATLVAWPLLAQSAGTPHKGFRPASDFVVEIDGEDRGEAEVLYAERSRAYLLLNAGFSSPLLIEVGAGSVSSVNMMKVNRKGDGSVDLFDNPGLRRVDRYRLDGGAVAFSVEGKTVRLKDKPPLLGLHDLAGMVDYAPDYGVGAEAYAPDAAALDALRALGKDLRVRVFFGSWCPFCKRHVPYILRADNELKDSPAVTFEYYGLPKGFNNEPEARRMKIDGVPTAVVFLDGEEIGRLTRNAWLRPEVSLNKLVKSSGS